MTCRRVCGIHCMGLGDDCSVVLVIVIVISNNLSAEKYNQPQKCSAALAVSILNDTVLKTVCEPVTNTSKKIKITFNFRIISDL